jgi:hypothetical protein
VSSIYARRSSSIWHLYASRPEQTGCLYVHFRQRTLRQHPRATQLDPGRVGLVNWFLGAPVAQMDRAVASGATGRRFESCQAYQLSSRSRLLTSEALRPWFIFGFSIIAHGELAGADIESCSGGRCSRPGPSRPAGPSQ